MTTATGRRERLSFLFLNVGHFLDHLFTLVFAAMGFFGACVSLFYRYRHQMAQLDRGRAT